MNPQEKITILLKYLVFAGLIFYSLIFLYHGVMLVLYPYDVDNSEAYLVNQALRLSQGEFLYPPIDEEPFLVDNYPPVYPLVLAAGTKIVGVCFHLARLISLTSTFITALLLALWTWELTKNKTASLYAALVFLSFYHVYDWCALARVDSLGIMLSVLGLYLMQRSWHWGWITLIILIALYTKQSLFAAPLSIFIYYLFTQQKRTAWMYLATLAASGLILFVLMNLLTDNGAYNHLVLYNNNTYRFTDLLYYTRHWVGVYTVWGCAPLLIVALGISQYGSKEQLTHAPAIPLLLFLYTVFSILESMLCGKIGSAPNYLLSLVCATAVGLGFIYHHITSNAKMATTWSALFFFALNITQLAGTFHLPIGGQMMFKHPLDYAYTPSTIDQQAATLLHNRLKRMEGPILSDRAGVPLAAGHKVEYQPFIFTQLSHQGLWDQSQILNRIAAQEFEAVTLMFDVSRPNWDRERFTEPFIEAVRTYYTIEQQYGGYFLYLPKTE